MPIEGDELMPVTPDKRGEPERDVDAVIYFRHGLDASRVKAQIEAMNANVRYSVPGTNIDLATSRPIDPRAPIAALVRIEP